MTTTTSAPLQQRTRGRWPRRLLQLYAGLGLYGLSIGTWTILVGVLVLLAWVPLRQRPGVGTLANVLVLGLALDATLALVPAPTALGWRVPLLLVGIVLNGVATGAYIGAGLGAGPRDGLSTGLAARGASLRVVRTSVEVGVLAVGWALGGNVGVGTVLYAATIGVLTHATIPALRLRTRVPAVR